MPTGRPIKAGVDYFSHDTSQRKTLFILKSKFGNDGYAFWFQLLEVLGRSETLSYDCGEVNNVEYLSAYIGIAWEKCLIILQTLANVEAIDSELWKKDKVIWSDNFTQRLAGVYVKRKAIVPQKPSLKVLSAPESIVIAPERTQSKVKESKVNKIKEKKRIKDFLSDSVEIGLVDFFIGLLDARDYEWKKGQKANKQVWASDFDKLIRIDGREPERIKEVLTWSQADTFWCSNILSPIKLRAKWGQLTEKMKTENKNKITSPVSSGSYCPLHGTYPSSYSKCPLCQ